VKNVCGSIQQLVTNQSELIYSREELFLTPYALYAVWKRRLLDTYCGTGH
jgi:hypothetical protein